MDSALLERLLREKNARLRDKDRHIQDLQNLLWEAYHGDCNHDEPDPLPEGFTLPEPEPERLEEPREINGTEELVAKIIGDLFTI